MRRLIFALAALALAGIAADVSAATNCTTTCYDAGSQRVCYTNCY